MRPFVTTVAGSAGGVSYSRVYVVDHYAVPTNIGIGVKVQFGGGLYDVQHTFDDPFTQDLNVPTNGVWYNNDILSSASTNDDTNYAFPITAIRLAHRANASAQAVMTIIQSGPN